MKAQNYTRSGVKSLLNQQVLIYNVILASCLTKAITDKLLMTSSLTSFCLKPALLAARPVLWECPIALWE